MKKSPMQRSGRPAKPMFAYVGGASGSGKSSFRKMHPEVFRSFPFYDVDQITAELENGPDFQEGQGWPEARKRVDQAIREHMRNKESFGTETTFILPERINLLINARKQGYLTRLFFFGTRDVDTNIRRVRGRVEGGGHGVPEEAIRNDWHEAPRNLEKNLFNIDIVEIYESKDLNDMELIAVKKEDHRFNLRKNVTIPEWAQRIVDKGLSEQKFG